jgi:hypothetical protein
VSPGELRGEGGNGLLKTCLLLPNVPPPLLPLPPSCLPSGGEESPFDPDVENIGAEELCMLILDIHCSDRYLWQPSESPSVCLAHVPVSFRAAESNPSCLRSIENRRRRSGRSYLCVAGEQVARQTSAKQTIPYKLPLRSTTSALSSHIHNLGRGWNVGCFLFSAPSMQSRVSYYAYQVQKQENKQWNN